MRIVIIFTTPFPYGEAGANRVISYTKAMAQLGHDVTVHCLQPPVRYSEKDNPKVPKPDVEGSINGIRYVHTAGTIYWPEEGKSLCKKLWLRFKSYIGSAKMIWRERKDIDIVQIYSHDTNPFYFYHFVTALCGVKFVSERSELPNFVKRKDSYQKTWRGRMKTRLGERAFKFFDAWILETQTLADYYLPRAKKNVPYLLVPMTVEEDRFVGLQKVASEYGRYVAYCGNMREDDGMSILIRAFAKVAGIYPDIKLVLAGNSKDVPAQKQLTASLNMTDRILFIGRLTRDEIPSFITNAEVLCLASPSSARASASMPCKVGEYMCTGNPTICTGQGEILKYLEDGKNAYLPAPDSVDAFAEKLDYVLSHPSEAKVVAMEGVNVALREFGTMSQARRMIEFYGSLSD